MVGAISGAWGKVVHLGQFAVDAFVCARAQCSGMLKNANTYGAFIAVGAGLQRAVTPNCSDYLGLGVVVWSAEGYSRSLLLILL